MHILRLPAELLVNIAELVPVETLLVLRLVSKDIGSSAFDRFAEHYLAQLACCLLDRSRLQRLKRITSTKHLLDKIQRVDFTVKAMEYATCDDFPLVPNYPGEFNTYMAQVSVARLDSRDLHENAVHDTHPSQALLASVLFDLESRPSIYVCFDFEAVNFDGLHSAALHESLEAAVAVSCPVSELHMCDNSTIHPTQIGTSYVYTFADMCANIGRLSYEQLLSPYGTRTDSAYNERAEQSLLGFRSMLRQARHLMYLHISLKPVLSELTEMLDVLRSNSFPFLRDLELSGFRVEPQALVEVLQSMSNSMTRVALINLTLVSNYRAMSSLFQGLLRMPQLEKFAINCVTKFATSTSTCSQVHFRQPDNPDDPDVCDVEASTALILEGRDELFRALRWHFERGVVYNRLDGVLS